METYINVKPVSIRNLGIYVLYVQSIFAEPLHPSILAVLKNP